MVKKIFAWLLVLALAANLLPVGAAAISETAEDNLSEEQGTRFEIVPVESTAFSDNMKTTDGMTVPSEYDTSATSDQSVVRYTVLLLDLEVGFTMTQNDVEIYNVSTPMETVKKAATRFVEQISTANGTNYVAIVSYGENSYVDCGFTTNKTTLLDTIENLDVLSGVANMTAAYEDADELLRAIENDNAIKNVVMFSQGIPGVGSYSSSGKYDEDDCSWYNGGTGVFIYEYANAVYAKAADMMERYNLYSIGLFQQFDEVPEAGRSLLEFAMMHAEDIQNKGYQCVDDVDDLEFAFGDVADDVVNKWDKYLDLDTDVNIFSHKGMRYAISNQDYIWELLRANHMAWDNAIIINNQLNSTEEKGYCHGLAVSMCLGTQGKLDFSSLPSWNGGNAYNYYSLLAPYATVPSSGAKNTAFRDLLIYYQLTQHTLSGDYTKHVNNSGFAKEWRLEGFLSSLVKEAIRSEKEEKPFVFSFRYYVLDKNGNNVKENNSSKIDGHSVVVCGYNWNETAKQHEIQIYDENSSSAGCEYYVMSVSEDYSAFSFIDANSRYYRDKGFAVYKLEDKWVELRYYGIDTIHNGLTVVSEPAASQTAESDTATITISANASFTIHNQYGDAIDYSNGVFTNTMDIYDIMLAGSETNPYWTIEVPISDTFHLTNISDGCDVIVTINGKEYAAQCDGASAVTFSNDGIVVEGGAVSYNVSMAPSIDNVEIVRMRGTSSGVSTFRYDGDQKQSVEVLSDSTMKGIKVYAYSGFSPEAVRIPDSETFTIIDSTEKDGAAVVVDETEMQTRKEFNPFVDVPEDSFCYEPVLWAVEESITNGIDATHFSPGGSCNRAQVVTFLWRAAGSPEPAVTENPFVDVEKGSFFEKAVLWAVEEGITTGTDGSHFSPAQTCNRATVVTFLYRAFGEPAVESSSNPFKDVPADEWYTAPILWAVEQNITNGVSADSFAPGQNCNRAQIVTFLFRAYVN